MVRVGQRPNPIRVVVVDDSALMRKIISSTLADDSQIEVVGHAANAIEARAAIKALDPHVVTLDVEMPDMDGLEFLEKLMSLRPTPVVMVSSFSRDGAALMVRALELGAIDCIAKPNSQNLEGFRDLAQKIKVAAMTRLSSPGTVRKRVVAKRSYEPSYSGTVVAIGSSTGGVEALVQILTEFPENCPATVITQHMPAGFTRSFSERLNRLCLPHVAEATDGAVLSPGQIYLAPGGATHLEIAGSDRQRRCVLREMDHVNGHRPSVDVLFESVAKSAGRDAIGVILTGMGHDGAAGLLSIRRASGRTIGQDENTCVIYGMPKAAMENGAVQKQLALDEIAAEILSLSASQSHRTQA